ncbi:hypothetical protein DH2020_042906 [Rehmannia glutinosa]|uniref:Galectin domain-containing protein n=1 Tax=Rehmannia glutinosa TaxID=99300 RepID=A0ABR0UM30_REHGL
MWARVYWLWLEEEEEEAEKLRNSGSNPNGLFFFFFFARIRISEMVSRQRSIRVLILLGLLYILLVCFEVPFVFKNGLSSVSQEGLFSNSNGLLSSKPSLLESEENLEEKEAPVRPLDVPYQSNVKEFSRTPLSRLDFTAGIVNLNLESGILKSAKDALEVGKKLWQELELVEKNSSSNREFSSYGSLNHSSKNKSELFAYDGCGKPRAAHAETDPKISLLKEGQYVMVSQFMMELQGLKTVEGEDPPRILHFNPRLKGDWSGKPVIEQNTCYRMQWGTSQRCEGWKSRADEETVDELVKCEKWIRDDDNGSEESKATWWLNRLIGRTKKVTIDWPFPFAEGKLFVLTLSAGLEGYHVNVDGRHVTSFPYRTMEISAYSIWAGRTLHWYSFSGQPLCERMAVRRSWMQHKLIKSSNVVVRFFVALNGRKEVNIEVKKEAEFFGDIVIVPYMDNYDLVVLKTVAIFEYGVRTVSAKYIMKGDDDTFVRVDAIVNEAKKVPEGRSLYIGNINYHHKPLRSGKWAVTYEEWPEEDYPPYANGPGYIISSDIANSILSDFEKHKLRLFKMEDVSVGMWVEKVNSTKPVEYVHSLKFCQFGCIEDYITAHYQSPRQMICLWNKLRQQGKPSYSPLKFIFSFVILRYCPVSSVDGKESNRVNITKESLAAQSEIV